jgi:4-hydroxy-2-oxoheptanedioate aldolase
MLKRSKVLDRMRNGETVNCFKFNLDGHRAVHMVSQMGFDCLWTDMEHTPNDLALIERQVLAARANDVDIIVRVPRGSYSDLIHPLEMNASAIMVPHITNVAQAEEIARMTKFHPLGRRPADGGNADGAYCLVDFVEYTQFVNKNRFVIIQIEDPEAMDELDEICAVDGIDMIFFGPGDYSHAIGFPGQMDHPLVVEARMKIAQCAVKHGKLAGTTGSTETFQEYRDMGYHLINIGADVFALNFYGNDLLKRFKECNNNG